MTDHAKDRLKQRFGIEATPRISRYLVGKIKKAEGFFLGKQSQRVSVWGITYKGKRIVAVYSKKGGKIITVVHANAFDPMEEWRIKEKQKKMVDATFPRGAFTAEDLKVLELFKERIA